MLFRWRWLSTLLGNSCSSNCNRSAQYAIVLEKLVKSFATLGIRKFALTIRVEICFDMRGPDKESGPQRIPHYRSSRIAKVSLYWRCNQLQSPGISLDTGVSGARLSLFLGNAFSASFNQTFKSFAGEEPKRSTPGGEKLRNHAEARGPNVVAVRPVRIRFLD